MEQLCKAAVMVNRHMIRGYNDQIYFTRQIGTSDKIVRIEIDAKGRVSTQEMFSLNNSMIMAFETDCENVQDDSSRIVENLLFVVDDKQKVYHLKDTGSELTLLRTIEVPSKKLETSRLYNTDWQHVHVTQNVIAYNGVLYSLNSKLCPKMRL